MVSIPTSRKPFLRKLTIRQLFAIFILAGGLLIILPASRFSARAQHAGRDIPHSQFFIPNSNDWGTIDITTDAGGDLVVTLENSEIRVVYQQSSNDFGVDHNGRPSCIDEFFVKDLNKDITDGGRFDNNLVQRAMTSAQLIYDGPDRKTVHMTWESGAEQEVSIFPAASYLQIDYISWDFLITDWPDWRNDDNAWQEQMIEVHGADLWHRTIDPADQPTHPDGWPWDPNDPSHFPNDPNAMREWGLGYSEIYYDRLPWDASKQGELDPFDGGPLNYNGHFIIGAHKLASGEGYGRTLPVSRTSAVVLWSYRGLEFTPDGGGRFTSYLYPVTGGKQEILSLGKQLIDGVEPLNAVDDNYTVDEGGTIDSLADTLPGVLDNDDDPDGSGLTATLLNDAGRGALTLNPDGSFVYIHDGSETTSDSFTYRASDGSGRSGSATVHITINPLNDKPAAVDDNYSIEQEGQTLIVEAFRGVLSNDSDPEDDTLNATLLTDVTHGDLTLNLDGSFIYTHDGSELTGDSFTYEADDGKGGVDSALVSINVAGPRVSDGLLALYTFMEDSGAIVHDVSGVGAALDLTIQDPANTAWVPGGGLAINAGTVVNSAGPAAKIVEGAKAVNELTIEAWLNPANTAQFGPARIVALSQDAAINGGNFILGQGPGDGDVSYDARLRTTATSIYGTPSLTSPNGSLSLNLTHVLFTRDAAGTTTLYLDAVQVATGSTSGDFSNWGDQALGLANEPDPSLGSRPWLGELYLVAIYDNALDQDQVLQNFSAGATADQMITQNVPLTVGWNTISSYVIPPEKENGIFLEDYPDLRLCKDDSGHVYFPELSIDTIGSWDTNKGYKCYAMSDFDLSITGPKVPGDAPLALPSGWSIIPYLSDSSMPIETALGGIANELVLAKDGQGNVYWPAFGIDEIGDLQPGQGYQVYLNQAAVLIYPVGGS